MGIVIGRLLNCWGSHSLMDRALDLKPEVTQGCGFKSRLWQEVSTTEVRPLSKAPNPQLLPGRRNVGCPLLHLDGLNAENTFHSSLSSSEFSLSFSFAFKYLINACAHFAFTFISGQLLIYNLQRHIFCNKHGTLINKTNKNTPLPCYKPNIKLQTFKCKKN